MLNQPASTVFSDPADQSIEPGSTVRFSAMFLVMAAALLTVLVRIAWVQAQLPDAYLAALRITSTEFELIPARDGRILMNSRVLATDKDRYSVEVHYRWLQSPPDDRWLARQVRSALSAEERRNQDLVESTRAALQQQQGDLWQRLQDVTGITSEEFERRRGAVQERVTRIADDVNRRRAERFRDESPTMSDPNDPGSEVHPSVLMRLAAEIRRAVTTPPRRQSLERIVVREEEDFHVLARDVSLNAAARIRAHPERFPGTQIAVGTQRTYPEASFCSHVVGARTELREDEAWPDGLNPGTAEEWRPRRGRSGVEYSWDHRLRGTPGLKKVVRNRRHEIVESADVRHPTAGSDVVLTIDAGLQQHVELLLAEALADRPGSLLNESTPADDTPQPVPAGGSVVVMDVTNGRLLAAASAPGFDLRLFTSGTADEWAAVNADRRQPFLSRITSMAIPPGSVFKPLTAVAALESGRLNPDHSIDCRGYLDNPDENRCLIFRLYGIGHGETNLQKAIAESCNVYFFEAARETGLRPLTRWAERFGFGEPTGIDLPFERSGTLPNIAPTAEAQHAREALGTAIGQARVTTTPLQIVRMIAAIANGGWLVVPHVVSLDGVPRTIDEIDDAARDLAPRRIPGLQPGTLVAVRAGLEAAVEQPSGTGYRTVRLDEVRIAGKTGTAETAPGQPDHAWFAGYVPADQPRYAFVVVLQGGGSGSRSAGPVARETVRFMLKHQLLQP